MSKNNIELEIEESTISKPQLSILGCQSHDKQKPLNLPFPELTAP